MCVELCSHHCCGHLCSNSCDYKVSPCPPFQMQKGINISDKLFKSSFDVWFYLKLWLNITALSITHTVVIVTVIVVIVIIIIIHILSTYNAFALNPAVTEHSAMVSHATKLHTIESIVTASCKDNLNKSSFNFNFCSSLRTRLLGKFCLQPR